MENASHWYVVTYTAVRDPGYVPGGCQGEVGSENWIDCFLEEDDDQALTRMREKAHSLINPDGTIALVRLDGDGEWTEVRQAEIRYEEPEVVHLTE